MNEFIIKNGLIVSGSAEIGDNLTIHGTLTANQYNVSVISSSVLYESGSTQFGDSIDDTHLFTGSIRISGSIDLNGQTLGTGKLDETTFESFTSSYLDVSSSLDGRVSDLESFSSSLDTSFVSEIEFGSHTSSINGRVDDLETESGSIRGDFNLFTSSYTNVSTSIDSRLDTLETLSGSFTGSFSGSFNGDGTNLYNIPASGVTGLNLTQIADGSVTASVSNTNGLRVNSKTEITGSLIVTNGITGSIDYSNITNKPTLVSGSSQIDITSTTGYSTFSSSVSSSIGSLSSSIATTTNDLDGRLDNVETSTGSLNSFTSSINTTIKDKLNDEGVISGSVQVTIGDTTGFSTFSSSVSSSIGSLSSSIATTTNDLDGRVDSIETSTGSLNSFTSSINTTIKDKLNTEGVVSGSIQVSITGTTGFSEFSSSISSSVTTIFVDNFEQDSRLDAIETSTGSLNSFTSSINTTIKNKLNTEGVISGSVQVNLPDVTGYSTFSSSISSSVGLLSSSIATTTNDLDSRLDSVETSTGSLNSFTSSINTTIKNKINTEGVISGSVQVNLPDVTGYSTFSSSVSSSIGSLSSSVATTDNTQNGRLSSLETESGSVRGDFNSYTSSNDLTNTTQNGRLNSLEGKSGSYATTGSNVFVGSQTISGSVIIRENLLVLGSSSITYVTSSQLRVDDNVIVVNTASPAERFGGLQVYDSGSIGEATGSLFWDSQKNRWVYQQSSESTYGGGVLLSGPRSSGSLGDELTLTSGKIARSAGGDHLNDSIITEYSGVTIGISGSLEITGSILSTTTPLVSGSGQISFNGITDKPTLVSGSSQVSFNGITDKPTLVSGSVQVDLTETTNYASGIKTRLNSEGVISGSSQISFGMISAIPSGLVSGSSQVLNGSGTWSGSAQLPSGIVSGAAQLPSGTVSGSSQVSFTGITDKPTLVSGSGQIIYSSITGIPSGIVSGSSQVLAGTTIHSGSFFNGISVVSGSSQVLNGSGVWSGSAQLPSGIVSGAAQLPSGTVSGSSQIIYSGMTGIPSGIVSGSVQVDLTTTMNYSSGIKTRLNAEGVISGSSQISFGMISAIPSGLVSGSGQIAFGSISGVPSGLVSGSGQIAFGSITGVPSGLVSGSSQVLAGTTIHSGSFFNGISVVSGSAQIAFGSITGVPSGLVSGSSQITLSSTTGFGSYLNQAVLTSSTPTFSTVSATTFTGALTGNASTATILKSVNTTSTSTSTWNPQSLTYQAWGQAFVNSNISADSGDVVMWLRASQYSVGASELCMIIDGDYYAGTGAYKVLHAGNYNSYSPTLTGTGASGSWSINSATSSRVVNGNSNPASTSFNNTMSPASSSNRVVNFDGNGTTPSVWWTNGIRAYGAIDASDPGLTFWSNNGSAWQQQVAMGHGTFNVLTTLQQGGNQVIHAGNIGSQSVNYANSAGSAPNASNQNTAYLVTPGEGNGLKFWADDNYKISMGASSVYQYGTVTDYSIKTQMNSGDAGRGFTWGRIGIVPIASLNATSGNMQLAGTLTTGGSILPLSNNSVNLGSASLGWANVYTNDLHLSNMNKPEGNDIDGTSGTWTIQEGAENLYIINNRNNKKFKISLEEIL